MLLRFLPCILKLNLCLISSSPVMKLFTLLTLHIIRFSVCSRCCSMSDRAHPMYWLENVYHHLSSFLPILTAYLPTPFIHVFNNGILNHIGVTYSSLLAACLGIPTPSNDINPLKHFDHCITTHKSQPNACIRAEEY